MGFQWAWVSKAGIVRNENQDYAGILLHDEFLFAVIADGVSSKEKSGELAAKFTTVLVDRAATLDRPPTGDEVAQWVLDAFHQFRRRETVLASVAFLAACFSHEQINFTVHAGDCRIGVRNEHDQVEWKTPVHSLATAIKQLDDNDLRSHPARNQLTRTFGNKRFKEPEIIQLNHEYVGGAALATDGFWACLPIEAQQNAFNAVWHCDESCEDDTSRLLIRPVEEQSENICFGENLYVRGRI